MITAIMLVRNEQYVLPITVGYLLSVIGADRVVIADNGSTDSTPQILRDLSKADERVRWLDASGPYLQAEIMNGLARDACRDGATWIIPNDADEFFWLGGGSFRSLDLPPRSGALMFGVRNFVQWYWINEEHPRALETMIFSSNPVRTWADARELVETDQIAFVQINYPPKLILRASLTTLLHKGNHDADGVNGERIWLNNAEVLHAPLRARSALEARIEKGQRVEEVGGSADESWHLRRLLRVARQGTIHSEWERNSTRFGKVGPENRKTGLRFDLRLRRIALMQRSSYARLHANSLK